MVVARPASRDSVDRGPSHSPSGSSDSRARVRRMDLLRLDGSWREPSGRKLADHVARLAQACPPCTCGRGDLCTSPRRISPRSSFLSKQTLVRTRNTTHFRAIS
jgi:hypothetical protein